MGKDVGVIVGLDIGTTKICAIVAENDTEGHLRVIGIGSAPSKGLRKGVVVDIESTVESVRKAVETAEEMTNIEIESVFSGIAGGHIKGFNSRGTIPIAGDAGEVTEEDIKRVIDSAKAVSIPMDRELIHVIPQAFIVDGHDGVRDPRGMSGVRLESEVHVITGAIASAQNIIKSINRAGIEVEDIVLQPLASSLAVLTEDEKKNGVVLIDIGGGTTDVVVYVDGAIRYTNVLAVGGDHISNDIAIALKIPVGKAEEIKKKYGHAHTQMVLPNEKFVVPGIVGRGANEMHKKYLAEIIQLRMEELFSVIKQEIKKTEYNEYIGSGVVITGGSALVRGTQDVAKKIFNVPVRIGKPHNVAGLMEIMDSPIYSTGVGLALYGAQYRRENDMGKFRGRNIFGKITERMRDWVTEYF
ncbi:MAG: cell division protein FtsA [Candidatus Ancaeobacter aquaticus]|nr:cell division protein FtsA [Candidatus Ancaeobacter aquaticus]